MDPNSGANFAHADRPDQPNLYFWQKISRWANLANFHPIWFKFCTKVIGKPLNRFRMFEVAATFFRPTSPTDQNRPIAKIINFCVFRPIWMKNIHKYSILLWCKLMEQIWRWANLANFHPIWFKFGTEVIGKPLNRFRMFEVAATIFRPTSPTNQNRPIAKIFNFCVFRPIWMKFGMGANNGPKTT